MSEVWCAKLENWDWEDSWVRSCRYFDNEADAKRCASYLEGLGNGCESSSSRVTCEKLEVESRFEPAPITYVFTGSKSKECYIDGYGAEINQYDIEAIYDNQRRDQHKIEITDDTITFDCVVTAVSQAQAIAIMEVLIGNALEESCGKES
jgi:hypothetical protein